MEDDFISFNRQPQNKEYACYAPPSFMSTKHPFQKSTPISRLNYELLTTAEHLLPTHEEAAARSSVFCRLKEYVEARMPCTLSTFGSYACGLYLSSSDVDVVVHEEGEDNRVLRRVLKVLKECPFVTGIIHLSRARVPILKCKDAVYGFKFDISVNQESSLRQKEFIAGELARHPYLRHFCVVLKLFLRQRGLGESKRGGLCSYGQFLLLLSFFQLHPVVQAGCVDPLHNMGVLLMDFFQFYGFDFGYEGVTVSVRERVYKRNEDQSLVLSLEDPVDPLNDVGALCSNMFAIRDVFQHAYRLMCCVMRVRLGRRDSVLSLWLKEDPGEEKWRKRVVQLWRAGVDRV